MRPTRRYWELVGVGGVLLASALVFDQPALLAGAAGVFGWLLAIQIAFVRTLGELDASLAVEQSSVWAATTIDEPFAVTFGVSGDVKGVDVTVSLQPSPGLEVNGTKTIELGETTVLTVRSAIAGVHTLEQPAVTVTDSRGMFVERLTRGPTREITVRPRKPKRVHIGEGGDAIPIAFGEHTSGSGESGLTPAEIREYTGGESISRIDWKTTARLGTPHIREFDAESDLTTFLIVDARERLMSGPPGETAIEYLRSAALSYLSVVQSLRDPVGCFIVEDGHITRPVKPTNSTHGYESLRNQLRSMRVETANTALPRRTRTESLGQRSPMLDRKTVFGRTLATYTKPVVSMPEAEPLAAAVRRATTTQQGTVQIAVFTDDSDHTELRNVVAEAKQANARLRVFIAPKLFYGADTILDSNTARERYREFERFRRKLAAIDGVTAYEVTPQERIDRILETQRRTDTIPRTEMDGT